MELLSLSTEYDVIQKGLSAGEINCKEDPYKQGTLILGYALITIPEDYTICFGNPYISTPPKKTPIPLGNPLLFDNPWQVLTEWKKKDSIAVVSISRFEENIESQLQADFGQVGRMVRMMVMMVMRMMLHGTWNIYLHLP